ncbi:extracellular solute-binding protein, partial [Enterocloster bolteae]|uniref:extracellular solute-binding protein n=1 Tax=Enterocloster bolteae TaxID=208479 RepID=UPI00210D0F31
LYPRTTIVMYLYSRKSMFEKAGIDYPKTVDEFFDACEKLTVDTDGDGKTDQYGFGMRGGNGGHYMWSSFVFSALKDKDYYDAEGKASLADAKLAEMNQKY